MENDMERTDKMKINSYHGIANESGVESGYCVETRVERYNVIQELDASYQFYLHQHPYVQQLTQRLIRGGIPELQAADTACIPGNATLPGSVEVILDENVSIDIPSGSKVALKAEIEVATTGAGNILLESDMEVELTESVVATLSGIMRARLLGGIEITDEEGAEIPLPADYEAIVLGDTEILLNAHTEINLFQGEKVTLLFDTEVLLANGSILTIPNGKMVRLGRSRPLPELFEELFTKERYKPTKLVSHPYPVKDLDFSFSGAHRSSMPHR